MKQFLIILIAALGLCPPNSMAEEGMWPPLSISERIADMQRLGLKLSAEDIYSINKICLKDAIVQFGGGCTGVLVSENGLLLTNHHCGFGSIQKLSSLEHDYLSRGFWAGSFDEELPNPGLNVTFLVRMEDVTAKILEGVSPDMNEQARAALIRKNIDKAEKEAAKSTGFEAKVKPFYYGNQYCLFLNEVFRDIRLVGAPPTDIGSFGGDTDNWAWPRHTGDFSVFRIYASKENKPAEYSRENVPFKPRKYLEISLNGPVKGDFTMVFGFPGSTREYLTSYQVELIAFRENPLKVGLRQQRLDIIEAAMEGDAGIRIKYASKRAGIANGWKKMMGESKGIKRLNTISSKRESENKFLEWAAADNQRSQRYGRLMAEAEKTTQRMIPFDMAGIYISEGFMGIDLLRFAGTFRELIKSAEAKEPAFPEILKNSEKARAAAKTFYKDFNDAVDLKIAVSLLKTISSGMDPEFKPSYFQALEKKYEGDWKKFADDLYKSSVFADSARLMKVLTDHSVKSLRKLASDPAWLLSSSSSAVMEKMVNPVMQSCNRTLDSLQRIYISGLMVYQADRQFYPDANSTMRLAYGKVDDYSPADAVNYRFYTTVQGILEKENPAIYDYVVEPELKSLINKKDFGMYADRDGSMHVAFTASNHTTGGNSGSPVLDSRGRLIGLNFDRNWEGTMSDLQYDPGQCRNIVLDIRYCLFIIDRFAKAGRIVQEMSLVRD